MSNNLSAFDNVSNKEVLNGCSYDMNTFEKQLRDQNISDNVLDKDLTNGLLKRNIVVSNAKEEEKGDPLMSITFLKLNEEIVKNQLMSQILDADEEDMTRKKVLSKIETCRAKINEMAVENRVKDVIRKELDKCAFIASHDTLDGCLMLNGVLDGFETKVHDYLNKPRCPIHRLRTYIHAFCSRLTIIRRY